MVPNLLSEKVQISSCDDQSYGSGQYWFKLLTINQPGSKLLNLKAGYLIKHCRQNMLAWDTQCTNIKLKDFSKQLSFGSVKKKPETPFIDVSILY